MSETPETVSETPETHGWTHPQCFDCWEREQGSRQPVQLKERDREVCCYCGEVNWSGIYRRHDAKTLLHCPDND